jgi:hypothetical protein
MITPRQFLSLEERRAIMDKRKIRWILAVSTFVLLSTGGNAAGNQGKFCLELTSNILGVHHRVNVNYSDLKDGHVLVYGESCYTIGLPGGGSVSDCAPVNGSSIVQEGRRRGSLERVPMLEIELHAAEHHELFDHTTTTTSGTHIWIDNLADLTGTWAAQSVTSVEGVVQGLFQFDAGTVAGVPCPPKTDEDKESEQILKDTLKRLQKL